MGKSAAVGVKNAVNAIGNITGSNSVNVFLGLGLPWLIASIYHWANDSTFEMKDPSLPFSVLIFTICACTTIGFLMVRRCVEFFGNAELGGPTVPKAISSVIFVSLWVLYVVLASLQAYEYIPQL